MASATLLFSYRKLFADLYNSVKTNQMKKMACGTVRAIPIEVGEIGTESQRSKVLWRATPSSASTTASAVPTSSTSAVVPSAVSTTTTTTIVAVIVVVIVVVVCVEHGGAES